MIAGPIPFTAIVEYSRIYEVGDFDEFLYIIRLLDNTYMELESKKASKSSGSNRTNKGNNSKGRR